MDIPYTELSEQALNAIIEEFVTREGTEYGEADVPLATKVEQVRAQLAKGEIGLNYDPEAQTCQLYRLEG